MSVTAGDLYQSAEKLNSHADCEADWRATCARAYYAVFHEAFAYHEKLAAPGALDCARAGGKHEDLYTRLQNPTIRRSDPDYKLSRRLGYLMQDLHSKRVIADYKPESEVSEMTGKAEGRKVIARYAA